jgi:uncharacterized membrane protein
MPTTADHHAPTAHPGRRPVIWDAHHRLMAAGTVAIAVLLFLAWRRAPLSMEFLGSWIAFVLTSLTLAWSVISTKDPYEVRRNARIQDTSAKVTFAVVVTAATISLFAVAYVLHAAKSGSSGDLLLHVVLAAAAVLLSWTQVHTLFALRYAHAYFHDAHRVERHKVVGGLIFPGDKSPDYLDFAYFSFIIGMTCQVSDVQISSSRLRRLALIHGLIAFLFNTAILAMFVNIVAGLV